jgi:hypothetical protein
MRNVGDKRVGHASELATQASWPPLHLSTTHHLPTTIAQPNTAQLRCNEANILLAILTIKARQIGSLRQAAATYSAPRSTLTN